jgi:hypothetical protein
LSFCWICGGLGLHVLAQLLAELVSSFDHAPQQFLDRLGAHLALNFAVVPYFCAQLLAELVLGGAASALSSVSPGSMTT